MTKKANYEKAKKEADKILLENGYTDPAIIAKDIAINYGIKKVVFSKFKDKFIEVAGFIRLDERKIYVNTDDDPTRQNFTVAHELGHFLLGHLNKNNPFEVLLRKPIGGETDPQEQEANYFASCLLVPETMLKKYSHLPDYKLSQLFGVSENMIRHRKQFCKI